jgi:hypothetical protein
MIGTTFLDSTLLGERSQSDLLFWDNGRRQHPNRFFRWYRRRFRNVGWIRMESFDRAGQSVADLHTALATKFESQPDSRRSQ